MDSRFHFIQPLPSELFLYLIIKKPIPKNLTGSLIQAEVNFFLSLSGRQKMERGISKATENELLVNAARYQVESHFGALLSHNNPSQHQQRQLPLAPSPESAAEYSSHEEAVSADTPDRDDAKELELKSGS